MIERDFIVGRDARWLISLRLPACDKLAADLAKIIFDDGDVEWIALRSRNYRRRQQMGKKS